MSAKFKNTFKKGYTLVELLVVIGMISVLITGLILILNPVQKIAQTNDAKRKSDLAQLQRALEIYYQDYGRYPNSTASYTITGTNWGGAWSDYMSRLPSDPKSGRRYVYFVPNSGNCVNGQCYLIFASLEAPKDPQMCFPASGAACASAVSNSISNTCGGACNFGVSSPNTTP